MSTKRVMQFGGLALVAFAALLAVRTGHVAESLGAVPGVGVAVANDPSWMPFWFQLTFMRLFATALAGLGAILVWSASRLSSELLTSLARVVTLVLAALGLTAVTQQIAIWDTTAGWMIAGTFVALSAVCGMTSLRAMARPAFGDVNR